MESLPSIIVIYPYYGIFPWYFSYFVHSCKYNPSVTFLVITDSIIPAITLPSNVQIVNCSLSDIEAIASRKIGFRINLSYPFKLCDLRPAYGVIFSEFIVDYDFWGYGDIDVILGDLRRFITPELLTHYDIITLRHDYLCGFFTLFRNENKVNELFRMSKDYQKIFGSKTFYCFDETNYTWGEFSAGISYDLIHSDIESMTHLVKRLQHEGFIKAYFDLSIIEGIPGKLKWQQGKLIYKSRYEAALYHLISLKKVFIPDSVPSQLPDSFRISTSRIY